MKKTYAQVVSEVNNANQERQLKAEQLEQFGDLNAQLFYLILDLEDGAQTAFASSPITMKQREQLLAAARLIRGYCQANIDRIETGEE